MIGFFDYSMWLTYASLISAGLGILVSLNGSGHPYIGVFFLLICGFCDAFDGRVARSKKNRTETEKKYGIQLDSLADIVAFGVLPIAIGNAALRVSPRVSATIEQTGKTINFSTTLLPYTIMLIYLLAGLVRLAYFNVMEEERQKTEGGHRKYYQGLPITSAVMIFPSVMLLQFLTVPDITAIYFAAMLITAVLFVIDIHVPKPGLRGILIMCGIGLVEFVWFIIAWFVLK